DHERAVVRVETIEERVGAATPVEGDRRLTHQGEMDLVCHVGVAGPAGQRQEGDGQGPVWTAKLATIAETRGADRHGTSLWQTHEARQPNSIKQGVIPGVVGPLPTPLKRRK